MKFIESEDLRELSYLTKKLNFALQAPFCQDDYDGVMGYINSSIYEAAKRGHSRCLLRFDQPRFEEYDLGKYYSLLSECGYGVKMERFEDRLWELTIKWSEEPHYGCIFCK